MSNRYSFRDLRETYRPRSIVAISTRLGQRVGREEMIAAAFRTWERTVIEEALGEQAAALLPEAIRLVATAPLDEMKRLAKPSRKKSDPQPSPQTPLTTPSSAAPHPAVSQS